VGTKVKVIYIGSDKPFRGRQKRGNKDGNHGAPNFIMIIFGEGGRKLGRRPCTMASQHYPVKGREGPKPGRGGGNKESLTSGRGETERKGFLNKKGKPPRPIGPGVNG